MVTYVAPALYKSSTSLVSWEVTTMIVFLLVCFIFLISNKFVSKFGIVETIILILDRFNSSRNSSSSASPYLQLIFSLCNFWITSGL